jgi:sugar lactone lactonase YvrE
VCIASGLALDAAGNIFVAEGASGQVYKLIPGPPGTMATPFGTNTFREPGALAIAFDKHGDLWVTEGNVAPIQGRVWKIPSGGGVDKAEQFRIPPLLNTQSVGQDVRRTVGLVTPPGFTNAGLSVATGIAFNQNGDLFISDLSRKAIWKVEFNPDRSLKSLIDCDKTYHPNTLCLSNLFIQHPLLGAQIALDVAGNIWSGVPDRNAIAVVTTCGNVEEIFRNPVNSFQRRNSDTDNTLILEFPNSPVLLDKQFCVSNFDQDIQDNSPNSAGELNPLTGPMGKISCMDQVLSIPGMPLPVQ